MYLLDASAILALLRRESGYEKVVNYISKGASITSINAAEVVFRIHRNGGELSLSELVQHTNLSIIGFGLEELESLLSLIFPSNINLSLADKICLACGEATGLTIVTADRAWKEVNLKTEIICIR